MIKVRTNRTRKLLVLFVYLGGKSMITGEMNFKVWAVGTDDGKNTYEIRRKWGEDGKKALVIELYPTISADNCGMLDVSTMHLMNHVNDFGWKEMRIVNLYATVITKKPSVSELQENSLAYIEEILEEDDIKEYDIVIAWGNSLSTHKSTILAKQDLLSMIAEKGLSKNVKSISVDGISMKSIGAHPLYLGLHYPREKWNLVNYPLKEGLEALMQSEKRDKTEKGKKAINTEKKKGKAESHECKNKDMGSVENVKTDKSIVG